MIPRGRGGGEVRRDSGPFALLDTLPHTARQWGRVAHRGGVMAEEFPLWAKWLVASLAALSLGLPADHRGANMELVAYPLYGLAVLFGLFALWSVPPVVALRSRWQKRQDLRKREREAKEERARLERDWRPWAEAWVDYFCSVGLMLSWYSRLVDAYRGETEPTKAEYLQRVGQFASKALEQAKALHPDDRKLAETHLPYFVEMAENQGDPVELLVRQTDFSNHVNYREHYIYREIRRKLCLPMPNQAEAARLPESSSTPAEDPQTARTDS